MKMFRTALLLIATLAFAASAQAASMVYTPSALQFDLVPGATYTVPVTISVDQTDGSQLFLGVWVLGPPGQDFAGDIPREWVSAFPEYNFVWSAAPTVTSWITVSVPEEVDPGGYFAANVYPQVWSTGGVDTGDGLFIELGNGGAECTVLPEIAVDAASPSTLWPPNGKTRKVTVEGTISVAEGCTLLATAYAVNDTAGELTSTPIEDEELDVAPDGSFTLDLYLPAARPGNGQGDRIYGIVMFAESEAGVGASELVTVTAPHDMRNKK